MSHNKTALLIHFNVLNYMRAYLPYRLIGPVVSHSGHHHIVANRVKTVSLNREHLLEEHVLLVWTGNELLVQLLVLPDASQVAGGEHVFAAQVGVVVDSELVMEYMGHNNSLYFPQVYNIYTLLAI
jgi:hypothetical protein